MNIHGIQVLDADSEARFLANVKQCVMSGQTNKNMMGIVMDGLSGAYVLTQGNVIMKPEEFVGYTLILSNKDGLITLQQRLKKHNVPEFSGRALFSSLLPPDFFYRSENVRIIDGILIEGTITKKEIGTSHRSIIQDMWKEYGFERVAEFLTDTPRVIDAYLTNHPISVGLAECYPTDVSTFNSEVKAEVERARMMVRAMGSKLKDTLEEKRREDQIKGHVNTAKNMGKSLFVKNLPENNTFLVMAGSGAKGDFSNLAQITASLGQQYEKGERIPTKLTGGTRCFPYFASGDESIESRGFCKSSFLEGLTPAEYIAHAMASRIGLINTAITTADTGHMHHKLVKAMEGLVIAYDGSVRNSNGQIIQFAYGDDGFNAEDLQNVSTPSGTFPMFADIKTIAAKIRARYQSEFRRDKPLFESEVITRLSSAVSRPDRKTPPYMTKFEKSRIIATRAKMISQDMPAMVKIPEGVYDPIKIAEIELEQKVLPLIVVRTLPDGSVEEWKASELTVLQ